MFRLEKSTTSSNSQSTALAQLWFIDIPVLLATIFIWAITPNIVESTAEQGQ